jgi:hypothetical protein
LKTILCVKEEIRTGSCAGNPDARSEELIMQDFFCPKCQKIPKMLVFLLTPSFFLEYTAGRKPNGKFADCWPMDSDHFLEGRWKN